MVTTAENMSRPATPTLEERALVLAPAGSDADVVCRVLREADVDAASCESTLDLCRRIAEGAAAAIIAEEALTPDSVQSLVALLAAQPDWSDFPLIVLTGRREENRQVWPLLDGLNGSAHPLLLERPLTTATLIRAVRTVLQSRRRQYQIRDEIIERNRLARQLQEKVEELAQSDRRKDEFLAVLGHELRNPLAAIVNGIEVLPRLGRLDPQSAGVCDLIGRQAKQMTHLVDDLLDISRVSSGTIRLRVERLDLAELIRQVAAEHRSAAEESGCVLDVELTESLPVDGDPTRLRQVIGNLVHNACKFTDPGGRITITGGRDSDRRVATITVRDTGIGISRASLPRLFQPFKQAEASLDRSRGGLGLGLALVRGLVELHAGSVTASSPGPGRGSEFTVHLPLAAGDAEASPESPSSARPLAPVTFRILLVEDSQPVAEIFSLILQQMGCDVQVATDAVTALERIPIHRPQLILSDISMPGMNGYELAERIRREPDWNSMLLVAVTGFGQPEDRARAQQAGFDYHLVKPVDLQQLEQLFEAIASRTEHPAGPA